MPNNGKDKRDRIRRKYRAGVVKFTPNSFLTEPEARLEAGTPPFVAQFIADVYNKKRQRIVRGDVTVDTIKIDRWRDLPLGVRAPLPPKYQGYAAWKD